MKRFVQSCVDGMFNLNKNVRIVINILIFKVLKNIEKAQGKQKKAFEAKKRKGVRQCSVEVGDEVLIGEPKKKVKKGNCLQDLHQGPFTLTYLTEKGVASVAMSGKIQKVNVSQLRPYFRPQGIVIILLGDMANINLTMTISIYFPAV